MMASVARPLVTSAAVASVARPLMASAVVATVLVRRSAVTSLQGPPRWSPQSGLLACARGVVARPPR